MPAESSIQLTYAGLGFHDVPITVNPLNGQFFDITFDITAGIPDDGGFNQ